MYNNIYELIRNKKLIITSAEAAYELGMEDDMDESVQPVSNETPEVETPTTPTEEETVEITKVQTIDVLSQVMGKFDIYMAKTNIDFNYLINNGKIVKTPNFKVLEDFKTLLNKTFDEDKFSTVKDFNLLYDMLSDDSEFTKALSIYGRENYKKPFIAEGLALLMYEYAIDYATVLARYYKDLPNINNDIAEEDSFFKKFPNMQLTSYITHLIVNSKDMRKFIVSEEARDLIKDDTKYNLNDKDFNKKPNLFKIKGESLSYYASLVRYDYADIAVGLVDKLAIVAFISGNTKMELKDRLDIIPALIKNVSRPIMPVIDQNQTVTKTGLDLLNDKCLDLLKDRSDARIILDSNDKNYPMTI